MSKEYIEKVFQKFDEHLNIENNNRIIFSGKFGIGKSFFLNEFFKEEIFKNQYFPILLNPVNYSVASNEDIFELIKFDILYQILDNEIIDFKKFEFSKGNLFYQYVANKLQETFIANVDSIGESIINEVPGKPYKFLKNFATLLSKLEECGLRDYQKFEKEIQSNPELKTIDDFFKINQKKIGSQYEHNAITQVIYNLIHKIEEENDIKTVLIIDDLDRIDPEHIFRILNILSAHEKLGENKFGFEKIVLVCDLKNIESIYHHFYGNEVDFFGYINKFYSKEPHYYSNEDYYLFFEKNFKTSDHNSEIHISFLKYLISIGIRNNLITARQIFHNDFSLEYIQNKFSYYFQKSYKAVYFKGKSIDFFSVYRMNYAIFKTLIYFFGNSKNVISSMESLDRQILIFFDSDNLIANFIGLARLYNPQPNSTYSSITFYGLNMESQERNFMLKNRNELKAADLNNFFQDLLEVIDKIKIDE